MTTRSLTKTILGPCLVLGGIGAAQAATPANPLLAPGNLPYDAPPFDRIHDADYAPAIEAAMREHQAEIERIADNPAAPDFDNTIVAMERSGATLTRVVQIFENITQSNTDPALDAAKDDIDPKLQAHEDSIHLNPQLFGRVRNVHAAADTLGLDSKSRYMLDEIYKELYMPVRRCRPPTRRGCAR